MQLQILDVGITDFVTMSDGAKIDNPKFLRDSIGRLKVLQRRLSQKRSDRKTIALRKRLVMCHGASFSDNLSTSVSGTEKLC
jgi:putative transposase